MIVKSFLTWIQALAASLGAPGLFLVAALDSSFLSLPQVNDLLLILSVTRHPEWMPLYASMSTLGSLAGCFVMYGIGRKGEEALIRKRFSGPRSQRALALFNRFGMLAVLVPAILPPPAPFKIFVILAGASRMNPWTFAIAIVLGRGFRYFGEGPPRGVVRRAGARLPAGERPPGRAVDGPDRARARRRAISGGDRGGGPPSSHRCRRRDSAA